MTARSRSPIFRTFLDIIFSKSALQKKRITTHLKTTDELFWERAERFAEGFLGYLMEIGTTPEGAVDAYLRLCNSMLVEKTHFARTGKYRYQSAQKVDEQVYSNPDVMSYHMQGLALSQFLWPNHYSMYARFQREMAEYGHKVRKYLEIGAGHGLFLSESLQAAPNASFTVVDISKVSIDMASRMIRHLSSYSGPVQFRLQDVMTFDSSSTFDFITMGELIEHVDDPGELLRKVYRLLKPEGRAYITTCCNCPSIDHVYLFESVEQIRCLLGQAEFHLVSELVLPVEGAFTVAEGCGCLEMNYAAVVTPSKS